MKELEMENVGLRQTVADLSLEKLFLRRCKGKLLSPIPIAYVQGMQTGSSECKVWLLGGGNRTTQRYMPFVCGFSCPGARR